MGPLLCTCRLNWAKWTWWGWWDEWDDTALQTENAKFESWWSEAKHATSLPRRLPTALSLYEWAGKKHFVFLKFECQSGVRTRDLRFSKQAASTTTPGSRPILSCKTKRPSPKIKRDPRQSRNENKIDGDKEKNWRTGIFQFFS